MTTIRVIIIILIVVICVSIFIQVSNVHLVKSRSLEGMDASGPPAMIFLPDNATTEDITNMLSKLEMTYNEMITNNKTLTNLLLDNALYSQTRIKAEIAMIKANDATNKTANFDKLNEMMKTFQKKTEGINALFADISMM